MNGEAFSKLLTQANSYQLTAHTPFLKEVRGHSLDAFYKLQLRKSVVATAPMSFSVNLNQIAEEETRAILNGDKSIEDAVHTLQYLGNGILP